MENNPLINNFKWFLLALHESLSLSNSCSHAPTIMAGLVFFSPLRAYLAIKSCLCAWGKEGGEVLLSPAKSLFSTCSHWDYGWSGSLALLRDMGRRIAEETGDSRARDFLFQSSYQWPCDEGIVHLCWEWPPSDSLYFTYSLLLLYQLCYCLCFVILCILCFTVPSCFVLLYLYLLLLHILPPLSSYQKIHYIGMKLFWNEIILLCFVDLMSIMSLWSKNIFIYLLIIVKY